MTPTVETYEARRGLSLRKQWCWRIRAANGRIIAVSSDSYGNQPEMMRGLEITRAALLRPQI